MLVTGKQAHVLEHLDRVKPLAYKLQIQSPVRRYQLDGWECTAQITGLIVKSLISETSGALTRTEAQRYSVRHCDLIR